MSEEASKNVAHIKALGLCGHLSADGKRVCILPPDHEERHDPDTERGLYPKYEVRKLIRYTDQRGEESMIPSPTPLQEPFFVLRYTTDPHAWAALNEYASSCSLDYPQLSRDLYDEVRKHAPEGFYE